jgi:hypothetical protein
MRPTRAHSEHPRLVAALIQAVLSVCVLGLVAGCDPDDADRPAEGQSREQHAAPSQQAVERKPAPLPVRVSGRSDGLSDRSTPAQSAKPQRPVESSAQRPQAEAEQAEPVKIDLVTLEILKELRDSWAGSDLATARRDTKQ